jgi:hypothetical protein
VKYQPKHVEQLTDLNKLYSVASRWIIISTKLRLWELRKLTGDNDVEPGLFVMTPYKSTDVSKNRLFISSRWKRDDA